MHFTYPPTRFRKKPVVIDALQFDGYNSDQIITFMGGERVAEAEVKMLSGPGRGMHEVLVIHTIEGGMTASPGDWVIRGVRGEYYPCKPDVFDQTYEPVDSD